MLTLRDMAGDFTLIKVPLRQIKAFLRYKYAEHRFLSVVDKTVDINDIKAYNEYWVDVCIKKSKYEKAKEEYDSILRNLKP